MDAAAFAVRHLHNPFPAKARLSLAGGEKSRAAAQREWRRRRHNVPPARAPAIFLMRAPSQSRRHPLIFLRIVICKWVLPAPNGTKSITYIR
ncbi:hypothetical protein EVAR_4426_1 [Eumeta japonica]|uniref:Uncharacterized protein n=1 Tax=Eumeta variegata TaxID=151549 RepID=A0A4C1SYI8_EUMVA|nr:hypothetical protein EVAR_4426_1 [Eumeta japonica]